METILIIEDNEELCNNVSNLLGSEGFSLVTAGSGEEGLSLFDSHIDLIVLDVMLPGISGIDVCREIRRKSFVPILFLTAKTEDTDKALGLLSGGDDYLVKPFSFIELVARIRALLRRSRQYSRDNTEENGVAYQAKEQWLFRGILRVNSNVNEVFLREQPVRLTEIEYQILLVLIRHPGMIFSGEKIYQLIWGAEYMQNYGNIVTVHIRNLQQKIEDDPQRPSMIKTVWGKGYRFVEKNE